MINKTKAICKHFETKSPTILCLLDTHFDEFSQQNIKALWKGNSLFANNISNRITAGISIHIANTNLTNTEFIKDKNGRYAFLNFDFQNKQYLLVSVYAPTGNITERKIFFQLLKKKIKQHYKKQRILILCGDFNCVENPLLDKASKTSNDTSINELNYLKSELNLIDIWRNRNINKIEFTCFSNSGYHSRLDRFYIKYDFRNNINNVQHKSFPFSDHSSIHLKLFTENTIQGPNIWCLNQKLLLDERYIEKITNFLISWKKTRTKFKYISKWWDEGKSIIKEMSISYSRKLTKINNKVKRSLNKRLKNAEKKGKSQLIHFLKGKLSNLQQREAKEHFLSKRVSWIDEGDDFDNFLPTLKLNNRNQHDVKQIIDSNGNTYTEQDEILKQFKSFYINLYKKSQTSETLQDEFLCGLQSHLDDETSNKTDKLFNKNDFREALFKLPDSKSPGSDGLPAEFYKTFWNLLENEFYLVYKESISKKLLTYKQREAIIKCIPKKGDLSKVSNWRPISLLNADYKILTKAVSIRLLKVLPQLVSEEQTCSIEGRKVSHNLLINRDVIQYANKKQLKACLISLDQMKAFDRVDWAFLLKVLHKMNFGNNFISLIELLYTKIFSRVKVNGFISDIFYIEQGLRQGCPLSALLYLLIAEILNHVINSDPLIKGIVVDDIEIKLSQYADDNSCFLIGDKSIFALFKLLQKYEKATAQKINISKTQALWLGKNIGRKDNLLNLNWTNSFITILGLPFGNNNVTTKLWTETICSMKNKLIIWKQCNISLKSKIAVIKTLLIPLIIYANTVYPMNENITSEIQKLFSEFLWSGKCPKIPTRILQLPIKLGGLGLPNILYFQKAIILTWVKEIFTSSSIHWKQFFFYFTNFYKNLFLYHNIFKITLSTKSINNARLPKFYDTLLKAWHSFTENQRPQIEEAELMLREPIFLNPLLGNIVPQQWYINSDHTINTIAHFYLNHKPLLMSTRQFNNYKSVKIQKQAHDIIKNAIPKEWQNTIKQKKSNENPKSLLNVWKKGENKSKLKTPISKLTCKNYYTELSSFSTLKAKKEQATFKTPFYDSWEKKTGQVNWHKVFLFLNNNKIHRKSVEIQYRLIHYGIVSRIALYNKKVSPSQICTRCLQKNEDIEHIFIFCNKTDEIWQTALKYMRAIVPQLIISNIFKTIIIGFSDDESHKKFLLPLEDIRLAFFQAVWLQRNKSTWNFLDIEGPTVFRAFLQKILQLRLKNDLKHKPSNLMVDYRKIIDLKGKTIRTKML